MVEQLQSESIGGESYDFFPLGQYVVRAPGVCNGRPTFKYTRIEVAGTLGRLASGESMESIVRGYSGRISREAVQEAVDIATQSFLSNLPELIAAQ